MSLVVHVGTLILYGFAPGDRSRIAAGLASELERLIVAHGLPRGLLAEDMAATLDAGTFRAPQGTRPELIGAIIARRIYDAPTDLRHEPSRGMAGD